MGTNKLTSEKLIKYHFNEMNTLESEAVKILIDENWDLQNELDQLKSTLSIIDTVAYSPSQQSIDAILKYASISNIVKSA
jgi:regulator of replication initiation timing